MKRQLQALLLGGVLAGISCLPAWAQSPANPSMWGYTGVLNVPSAEYIETAGFYSGLRYFPRNSGLSGAAYLSPLDKLEVGLVFGAPPADGFSALGASLKYTYLSQKEGHPLSLAIGASLLGLDNNQSYVPGNNVFLTLTRRVDLPLMDQDWHLMDVHAGFMGSLTGGRLVGAAEFPIMDYGRLKFEYLGSINTVDQAFNFGFNVTPLPNWVVELNMIQLPGQGFWDRDYVIGIGYRGNFGFGTPQPKPTPTPQPTSMATPPPLDNVSESGQLRLHIVDANQQNLSGAQAIITHQESKQVFESTSNDMGLIFWPKLPVGTYKLTLQKSALVPLNKTLLIKEDEQTTLELALVPTTAPVSGKISYEVGGALNAEDITLEVYDLQNKLLHRMQPNPDGTYSVALPPGSYVFKILNKGTQVLEKNHTLGTTAPLVANFSLPGAAPTPSATPQPEASEEPKVSTQIKGQIKGKTAKKPIGGVQLTLKNDEVLIITLTSPDGKYVFKDIPKGEYFLEVKKDGFKNRRFKITVRENEAITHSFELTPESN